MSCRLLLFASLLLVVMLTFVQVAHAGAWTREPGGWFLKVGYDRWVTGERFDGTGTRIPFEAPDPGFDDPNEYRSQAVRVYAEYGAADALTLIASSALEWLESEGRGMKRDNAGLSDVWFSGRQRVAPGPVVVSLQGDLKIPTGYDESASPALGTGRVDFGGRLLAGTATSRVYVTAEAGYLFRGGGMSDQIPLALEAGYTVQPNVALRGEIRATLSGQSAPLAGGSFDPALAESQSVTASGGLVLSGDPLDLVFTVDHAVAGENTLAGTRYTFSIWWER